MSVGLLESRPLSSLAEDLRRRNDQRTLSKRTVARRPCVGIRIRGRCRPGCVDIRASRSEQ